MNNRVKCRICNVELRSISNSHLRTHNLTLEEYKQLFPLAPIESDLTNFKKRENGKKLGESRKNIPRSEQVKEKISITKKRSPRPAWNKGIPKTENEKQQASRKALADYTSGKRVPHNKGKSMSEERKNNLRKLAAEKYKILRTQKRKDKEEKYRNLQVSIFDQLQRLYKRGVKLNFPVRVIRTSFCRLSTILKHTEFLEQEGFCLLEVNNVGCSSALLNYKIKCRSCGNENIQITNQHLRPCKYEKRQKSLCDVCDPRKYTRSKGEIEVGEFVRSFVPNTDGVLFNDRQMLNGQELDIFIPSMRLAFEYTGLFWHSENVHSDANNIFSKYQLAKERGIRVVFVFEDEWKHKQEICKSKIATILSNNSDTQQFEKVHYRVIDMELANHFLHENHLQGSDKTADIAIGAYVSDRLLSVMSFRTTINKKIVELTRFVPALVLNQTEAPMFEFACKKFGFEEVFGSCDLRWEPACVFTKLKFKNVGSSPPDFWYVPAGKVCRIHRLDNNLCEQYGKIWDCGNSVWNWKKNKGIRNTC